MAAFISLAISSCGDSGNKPADQTYSVYASTVVTTADVSKPQFIARVREICRRGWVSIERNVNAYSSWRDPKLSEDERFEQAAKNALLADIDFQIFDEIQDLGAPRHEEPEVEKIIGAMQSAVERGQKGLAPVASVAEAVELFAEYNRRASRYGLPQCLVNKTHLSGIGP